MTTATKMAAAALQAELKFRDGVKKQISVTFQNNLSSLIAAVQELNASTSRLLTELVEQEKSHGDVAQGNCDVTVSNTAYTLWLFDSPGQPAAGEEDAEESDDEGEPEEPEEPLKLQPPAKRTKT